MALAMAGLGGLGALGGLVVLGGPARWTAGVLLPLFALGAGVFVAGLRGLVLAAFTGAAARRSPAFRPDPDRDGAIAPRDTAFFGRRAI